MGPINAYSSNEHHGVGLNHSEHIGVQIGYSEAGVTSRILLFPFNSSRVVEHEYMTTNSSYHHMRRVHKVSIPDVFSIDLP